MELHLFGFFIIYDPRNKTNKNAVALIHLDRAAQLNKRKLVTTLKFSSL